MSKQRTKTELIHYLTHCFYKGCINFEINPDETLLITLEAQQKFLEATIYSDLIKKYPVNEKFNKLFFKKLINYLETKQEVHDEFYVHLCSLMKDKENDDYCYRHYLISKDMSKIITTKETNSMVVNGTTGMRTWEAALMLSDWALCNKDKFANRRILELGSGIGFTGITIAKMCEIHSIMLTDCHHDVLKALYENIKINFPNHRETETSSSLMFEDESKSIGVMPLDWNSTEDVFFDLVPDIVIGADIVYDPSILKPLCHVMKLFFERNHLLEVYIASVIRNEDTFKGFLETLDWMNFKYEDIKQPHCVFIEWDTNIPRCLLKIVSK